jgi:hypothetical protein
MGVHLDRQRWESHAFDTKRMANYRQVAWWKINIDDDIMYCCNTALEGRFLLLMW